MSDAAAVVLGLAAALVLGVAEVADQRSTKRVRQRRALSPTILLDLVRQPLWLASIVGTVLGFVLQVLALRYGPLALVEPLLVCDLVFAVLLSGSLGNRRLDPTLVGGVLAVAAGVAGFLAIARPTNGHSSVGFLAILPVGAGLTAAVAGCLLLARRGNNVRSLALALACGICYGAAAFLIKLVVAPTGAGLAGVLTNWPIYALAVVGPLGFLLNLNAFQQSVLIAPVISIITVCDPLISVALAFFLLDENVSSSPASIALEVIALIVMSVGIVVVAHRAPHLAAGARPGKARGGDDGQSRAHR